MRLTTLTIVLILTTFLVGCAGTASKVSVHNPYASSDKTQAASQHEPGIWDNYYNTDLGY